MNIEHLKDNGTDIAVISSEEKLIVDTKSSFVSTKEEAIQKLTETQ